MIKRFRILIINQFGFSKNEANGFIILLILMTVSMVIWQVVLPNLNRGQKNTTADDMEALEAWHEQVSSALVTPSVPDPTGRLVEVEETTRPFTFDPNTATEAELRTLGFSSHVAARIIKYRNAGGSFKLKSDLEKIYGIDHDLVKILMPWISLPATIAENTPSPELAPVEIADLNTAEVSDLQKIKGLGPVLSSRILKYRNLIGGFYDFNQLYEVYGLADSTILEMMTAFTLDTVKLAKISVNEADIKTLGAHPYVDYNVARVIVSFRVNHGKYQNLEDLKKIKIVGDSLAQKIGPYLTFETKLP